MPPELLVDVSLEVDTDLGAYAILQVLHVVLVNSQWVVRGRFLSCP